MASSTRLTVRRGEIHSVGAGCVCLVGCGVAGGPYRLSLSGAVPIHQRELSAASMCQRGRGGGRQKAGSRRDEAGGKT